jgi:tRNA pseudouridine38-40 synthase
MPDDRVLKLRLTYDGTEFKGWQRLAPGKGRTVQECLERSLEKILGKEVEAAGAGRTDAGVHALGQVASFHTESRRPAGSIMADLNAALPPDIACLSCEDADLRFHARYRASKKTYRYRVLNRAVPDPFQRRYSLHLAQSLDTEAMRRAAEVFLGTHNFQSFTNLKEKEKSFERTVYSALIEKNGDLVDMVFCGDGFLYNQVRIMASALIACGLGTMGAESIAEIIAAKDRERAPGAAGAFGLCLMNVSYE